MQPFDFFRIQSGDSTDLNRRDRFPTGAATARANAPLPPTISKIHQLFYLYRYWIRRFVNACKPRNRRALCLIAILLALWIATPVLALGSDYGDAPIELISIDAALTNTYASASHQTDGVTFLGLSVDSEPNNQPNFTADGDDTNGTPNDEDGVTFPLVGTTRVLSVGMSNSLTIKAAVSGYLNAWIDWNQDGDWIDTGEQIATNLGLTAGNHNLNVTVPDSAPHGATYARFRFSTASGLGSTGDTTSNGEVEDYKVNITLPPITSCSVGLLNGGFELPNIPLSGNGLPTLLQDFGGNRIVSYREDDVPAWGTIANSPSASSSFDYRNAIELWKGSQTYYPLIKPFEGSQFAEINANTDGRLYEDFALPAGAQVRWQVAHHGRDGSDTMIVSLGAPNNEIQQGSINITPNTEWRVYSGIYTVPGGQDITRFALKAVGGGGAGNFVDDVRLTAKCPPVVNGYKSVKLTTDVNNNSKINPGDTLTYSLYYKNTGSGPAAGFQINDPLPAGVTLTTAGIDVTTLQNGVVTTSAATKNPAYTGTAGTASNLLNPGALLDPGRVIRVDIPVTVNAATVGTLLNQGTAVSNDFSGSVLTDNIDSTTTGIGIAVPAGSVPQIAKISIDPTSIEVISGSTTGNLLLIKRITAIHDNSNLNPNDNTPLNTFVNDSTAANNPYWPNNTYLIGAKNAGKVLPGDSIEYTIYFLNPGPSGAKSLRICDILSANQSFKNAAYGVGKDLQIKIGDNPVQDLTAANDPPIDRTRVHPPGASSLPTNCNLATVNTSSFVVDIGVTGDAGTGIPNLALIPGATAAGTPDSYGWVRFKSIVQ
jgi:uncharacterized repeat protein (TIGR01451 family)